MLFKCLTYIKQISLKFITWDSDIRRVVYQCGSLWLKVSASANIVNVTHCKVYLILIWSVDHTADGLYLKCGHCLLHIKQEHKKENKIQLDNNENFKRLLKTHNFLLRWFCYLVFSRSEAHSSKALSLTGVSRQVSVPEKGADPWRPLFQR